MPAPSKPNTFSNTPTNTNVIDADQVNANFDVLYALLNKGVDASNTTNAFAKDNVEPAFERYKLIRIVESAALAALTSATYLIPPNGAAWPSVGSTTSDGTGIWRLDPADYTAGSRTTYYRLRVTCATNATAPGVSFTAGLYPVSSGGGGPGGVVPVLGSVVSGSTAAITTPSSSSLNQNASADFVAPAAGYYALGFVCSGAQAGSSRVGITVQLQYRQV